MSVRLVLAPAGAGKTAWALERARTVARRLEGSAYVCVASRLQALDCRRRLARAGGAMGVHVSTFDGLATACLDALRVPYAETDEAVEHRLLRAVARSLDLPHYGRLAGSPGLSNLLQRLMAELAAADVTPARFEGALGAGAEPRLAELALIYRAYREQSSDLGCVDRARLVSLARDAVARAGSDAWRGWSLLVVDGYDRLTPAQLSLLRALASRLPEVIVTLTGDAGAATPLVWQRFVHARGDIEDALGVRGEPLPVAAGRPNGLTARLESGLRGMAPAVPVGCSGVELLAAPDRPAEAREALRWLKERLVRDGLSPGDVALLARDVAAYRSYALQVAAEMGLPLRVAGGMPLSGAPVIAGLLDLLRLALPSKESGAGPSLPRRLVVEAWRSPYFDWDALLPCDERCPLRGGRGAAAWGGGAAGALDAAARWGRVIEGRAQWEEALGRLAAQSANSDAESDDGDPPSGRAPVGEGARCLLCRLRRFAARVTPPPTALTSRQLASWLEDLIGADAGIEPEGGVVDRAASGPGGVLARLRAPGGCRAAPTMERDVEALRALKDVLRGLVVAEDLLGDGVGSGLPEFYAELAGAIAVTRLTLPLPADYDEILMADVEAARGIPFRAVALLGLAEGEFPAALAEGVLLQDADRCLLRSRGIALEAPTESAEPERFYEAVTRASERLLITRPRLADNGAAWAPSPFWDEIRRLTGAVPATLTSDSAPPPQRAASWPELLAALAARPEAEAARHWARRHRPARWSAFVASMEALWARCGEGAGGAQGGARHPLGAECAARFGPDHIWSATRLEQYRTCPYMFFVAGVLCMEPRAMPAEGLDGRQLGATYHRLLEAYHGHPVSGVNLDDWMERVAAPILDDAPRRQGFRETAWWPQTRAEILRALGRCITALEACSEGYTEVLCEQPFGGDRPLVIRDGDDALRVRGLIDRVDRRPDGAVRIIDYKASGPSGFDNRAVAEGRKLQVPLYALAARDALGLGEPLDGFYWHVQHAKASGFTLAGFDGGPEAAFAAATSAAWQAVRAVRRGEFSPHPPRGGCPSYCPAAAFCWHFRPGPS